MHIQQLREVTPPIQNVVGLCKQITHIIFCEVSDIRSFPYVIM
jgi:hypothetical protein